MRSHVQGTIYLLHFTEPYKHARHYMGKPASSGLLRAVGLELAAHAARDKRTNSQLS